ncbi:MAG: hypothetical protein ABUT20_43215 [Bacteroidota bacterium]
MTKLIFGILLFVSVSSMAQTKGSISVIDFVKIKNEKRNETLYFYENNWKIYRDSALKNNYIKSYRLLTTKIDSLATFDIMLITEYSDSMQLKLSEERFQKIIKEIRPNGPKLLNDLKPNDFRQNVFTKWGETIFNAERK